MDNHDKVIEKNKIEDRFNAHNFQAEDIMAGTSCQVAAISCQV